MPHNAVSDVHFGWGALPEDRKIRVRDYRKSIPLVGKRHRLSTRAQQVGLLALDLTRQLQGLKIESMRVSSEAEDFWGAEADRVDFAWEELPFEFVHHRPRNPTTGAAVKHNRPCTKQPQTVVILRVLNNISIDIRSYCPRCWRTYSHLVEYLRTWSDDYKDIHQHRETLINACLAWRPPATTEGVET